MPDELPDLDQHNPVELDAEEWTEVYSRMKDFDSSLDHDHSMDY